MTIDELAQQFEPRLRKAFLDGVDEIRNAAQIQQIAEALERGDIQAAIDALAINREAYREFEDELAKAYSDGGAAALNELGIVRSAQGQRLNIRFNARDLEAERFIREHSSQLVTRIVDDQREAIRQAMQERLSEGDNPRTTALDIVGRVDRRTQRRTGGIVGLSAPQERYIANARRELAEGQYGAYFQRERRDRRFDATIRRAEREGRALTRQEIDRISGRDSSPQELYIANARRELAEGQYGAYFQRERRDRRFDATIRRAEREGRALTRQEIERISGRYSDRLLQLRGETIARTETLTGLRAAQYEAAKQLVASGKVPRNAVRLVWRATFDGRTRDSHATLHGESTGIDEPFVSPLTGARLRYPGDPQGGAKEVINCRCALRVRVDYGSNL